MVKRLAFGVVSFVVVCVVLMVLVQATVDSLDLPSVLALPGTLLIAVPLALIAARRLGQVTHPSLLLASALVAIGTLWAIVGIFHNIAEHAGGKFGWGDLLNRGNRTAIVASIMGMLLAPQAWLWLLNRLSANYSFKPTPLRGAA